jgi:pimaricinolide synthase PimS1
VRSLILASRRGREAAGAQELEAELTELGARVVVARCDVADRGQLVGLLESVPDEYPLTGVVHAAGVLDDGLVESLTAERLDRVLAPKVDAAWHLHELTERLGLSAFIMFSSAAGVMGNAGQGNYAAANAFLDSLAAYRQARGLAGTSMAWGWWAPASDMTGQLGEEDLLRLARSGVAALSAEQGLELFDAAYGTGEALLIPVRLDVAALRAQARAGMVPALLQGLVRSPQRRARDVAGGSLAMRLGGVPEDERPRVVLDLVRSHVATILGHASPDAIDSQSTFKELGFDSLAAVELRNRLGVVTGLRLPATLVFDYPTPKTLASHLLDTAVRDGLARAVPVDIELDKLESMLQSTTVDHAEQTRITARLQELMSLLGDAQQLQDGDRVAEKIQSASDDEIFGFIDEELGSSSELRDLGPDAVPTEGGAGNGR